ncbi:MAG: Cys-tRNA(Pro) deacylase [Actinomycetales bacterium]
MAARRTGGAATPAIHELQRLNIDFQVHAFDVSGAESVAGYGLEAAAALGVPPALVFKTLVTLVDERPCVAIVPVDCTLDLKALAAARKGRRAVMAEVAVAERLTGYVVGGISPLGQRRSLPTVLDASAQEHSTMYVSAGRRGMDISLHPADLLQATSGVLAAIARQDG